MTERFKFDVPAWTEQILLDAWEEKYGRLTEEFRTAFKSRAEVAKILKFHPEHIQVALMREKRLHRILRECEVIVSEIEHGLEEPFGGAPFSSAHLYEEYEYGKDFI